MTVQDGKILTYYDEDLGRYIVEWNKVHRMHGRGQTGEEETFQLILYDVRFHPTYAGTAS